MYESDPISSYHGASTNLESKKSKRRGKSEIAQGRFWLDTPFAMTAKVNRHGQVVLQMAAREKLNIRTGDTLVVIVHDPKGRIVLEKRSIRRAKGNNSKGYLNPRPLPSAVLQRIYMQPTDDWDKVEAEAVAISRRTLAGARPEEL